MSLAADGSTMVNPIETVKSGAKTNPWEVDGITGATISSRAIGDILKKSTANIVPTISANVEQIKLGNGGG